MIGYTKDKNEFYKGDYITHYIKNAVARSGGTFLHYQIFKELLTSSIYNKTLEVAHHDCRAGYSLLFIYPIRIRIFLSLIFYKAELDSIDEYEEYNIVNNIIDPIQNLELINTINKITISKSVKNIVKSIPEDFSLYKPYLLDLSRQLYIEKDFDLREDSLEEQLQKTFNLFDNKYKINKDFIEIASSNNRTKAMIYICKQLNYKSTSINILNKAIEKWTLDNLST